MMATEELKYFRSIYFNYVWLPVFRIQLVVPVSRCRQKKMLNWSTDRLPAASVLARGLAAVAADSGGATGGIAGRTADPPSANERPRDRSRLRGSSGMH